jgi:hypothetical protein
MAFKRRSDMPPAERRLDVYKLLSFVAAIPLVILGFTTDAGYLVSLAALLMGVVNIGTEIVRARRFGHPLLNRWIPQRHSTDQPAE